MVHLASSSAPSTTLLPVATVKGPGEGAHEFIMVTRDPQGELRAGEFVYYRAVVQGTLECIIGRVSACQASRTYPNGFMANPAIPPAQVAALLGHRSQAELFELCVSVIVFLTRRWGTS